MLLPNCHLIGSLLKRGDLRTWSEDLPSSNGSNDPLYTVLQRHRAGIISAYLTIMAIFLLLVIVFDEYIFPEMLHVLFGVLGDQTSQWDDWRNLASILNAPHDWTEKLLLIGIYIVLQGILLWGLGTIRLDRLAKTKWRTVSSFIPISAGAVLLTIAGLLLLSVAVQTAQNNFSDSANFMNGILNYGFPLFVGAWIFWFVVALIYWRGRTSATILYQMVKTVLAASWIEFSLALPIDIAARNRSQDCYCAPASYAALLLLVPALIFTIGPGLYLLYLRERELSLSEGGRARDILRRKSAIRRRLSNIKVETHVSNARTLSLIAIALGFVGFQLGTFNNQRASLFNEARDLGVIGYLKGKYIDDAHLNSLLNTQSVITIADTPFGRLQVDARPDPLDPNNSKSRDVSILGFKLPPSMAGPFTVHVTQNQDSWSTRKFSLDRLPPLRLEQILYDLDVNESLAPVQIIPKIKEKLYRRHVKLPSLDFWDFSTEAAAWMVGLFCVTVLIALRNSLRQILQSSDAGIAEPWLILDAEAFGERAAAVAWLFGIPLSGWLASFGLILSAMNNFEAASPAPNPLAVGLTYLLFLIIVTANTWSGIGIVADLVRIRETRRLIRDTPDENVAEGA